MLLVSAVGRQLARERCLLCWLLEKLSWQQQRAGGGDSNPAGPATGCT